MYFFNDGTDARQEDIIASDLCLQLSDLVITQRSLFVDIALLPSTCMSAVQFKEFENKLASRVTCGRRLGVPRYQNHQRAKEKGVKSNLYSEDDDCTSNASHFE